MNLLQQLQGMLGNAAGAPSTQNSPQTSQSSAPFGGALNGLLGPALLGGLAGALLTSKTARSVAGGALLAGTGAAVWNQLKNRMKESNAAGAPNSLPGQQPTASLPGAAQPDFPAQAQSAPRERVERLVRALVFAAKSDGHIDAQEQAAIYDKLKNLEIGSDAQTLVQQAMNEPLDPSLIANGVKSEEEALEVYAVSCAVVDIDHFMERGYLDALAAALKIPADVQSELEKQMRA